CWRSRRPAPLSRPTATTATAATAARATAGAGGCAAGSTRGAAGAGGAGPTTDSLGSSESAAAPGAGESAAALGARESADALGASVSTTTGQVAASSQVSASGQLAASCSCRPSQVPALPPALACTAVPYLRRGAGATAPHSSGFPPTTTPLQTLHMDIWGQAPVGGMDQESYFPLQNGIGERRIGLIMEVPRTSMIHAAAPHFLWPFAVRYVAHQLNLWPRVSLPETLPTLWWTGKVGVASVFWVWGTLSLVRDAKASKLSSRTLCCIFFGFPTDAPPWQFYHPCERRFFSSQDVTFDESVCFYRLHPHASHPVPLAPLFLVPIPPMVDPLPPQGPAPSGGSQVDPPPLVEQLEISCDFSSRAEGGDPAADDTAATRRSPRLETPPGFPPR
ncbi:unnamed protein product, partial [Closterium sp. NIES-53]